MATKGQKQFGETILDEVLKMKGEEKTNREIRYERLILWERFNSYHLTSVK